MVGEAGFPALNAAALENVAIGLEVPGLDENILKTGVEVPVFGDPLGIFKFYFRTGLSLHGNAGPAGKILPDVVHLARRMKNGGNRLQHFAGRHLLFVKHPSGAGDPHGIAPGGIVVPFAKPAVEFPTRIVSFSIAERIEENRPGGAFPAFVRFEHGFTIDLQLQGEFHAVTPGRLEEVPHFGGRGIVPAVAENDADDIDAGMEIFGDVEGDEPDPLLIAAHGRIEHPIADLATVEIEFVITDPRKVYPPRREPAAFEGVAEMRRRRRRFRGNAIA